MKNSQTTRTGRDVRLSPRDWDLHLDWILAWHCDLDLDRAILGSKFFDIHLSPCCNFILSFLANEGGVCAKFHELFIDAEDPNLSQWESRNTGIVNFAYHLKALPTTVSKLAFAHEIGHSFGSPVSFTRIWSQIFHVKSFKMMHFMSLYFNFSVRYL